MIGFLLTRTLITWDPFYEDGNYINYFKSFIQDYDLNIINQQSSLYSWMVTKNLFDTAQHSFLQTPFIILIAIPEIILSWVGVGLNDFLEYHFSSYLFSIVCLFLGLRETNKVLKLFNLKVVKQHVFTVLFGSTLFYFSFLRYNVLEIFSFALCARVFYLFCRDQLNNLITYKVIDSFIMAILLCLKPAFLPLVGFVFFRKLKTLYEKKNMIDIVIVISFFSFTLLCNYGLWFQKYGVFPSTTNQFSEVMLYSPSLFFSKVLLLFELKGFFFANPALFIATIGTLCFLWQKWKSKTFTLIGLLVLLVWLVGSFTQTFFIAMPLLDDHLVGRLNLTSLPLLFIGFVYIWDKYLEPINRFNVLILLIILVSSFSTLYYISHDLQGHFSYAKTKQINFEQFLYGMSLYSDKIIVNIAKIYENLVVLLGYFAALSLIVYSYFRFRGFLDKKIIAHSLVAFSFFCDVH
jgi:hypothetical protein